MSPSSTLFRIASFTAKGKLHKVAAFLYLNNWYCHESLALIKAGVFMGGVKTLTPAKLVVLVAVFGNLSVLVLGRSHYYVFVESTVCALYARMHETSEL